MVLLDMGFSGVPLFSVLSLINPKFRVTEIPVNSVFQERLKHIGFNYSLIIVKVLVSNSISPSFTKTSSQHFCCLIYHHHDCSNPLYVNYSHLIKGNWSFNHFINQVPPLVFGVLGATLIIFLRKSKEMSGCLSTKDIEETYPEDQAG